MPASTRAGAGVMRRRPTVRRTRRWSWIVQRIALACAGACYPTIHRPSRPARGARRARRAGRQPALVLAPARPRTSSREVDPALWESTGRDPVQLLGAVGRGPARGAGRRRGLPRRGSARRAPTWRRTSPRTAGTSAGSPRADGPAAIGYFSPGVRHHRRAAAVLRRPRHPRRRPPQGGQRPRRPDRRRRAALPARLLQAVALARGLAAGDLPGPRPRRAADLAAARGRRHARDDLASTCPTARRWSPGSGWPASAGCRC